MFDLIPQTPFPTPINLSHKSIISNRLHDVSFPFPTHPKHLGIKISYTFSGAIPYIAPATPSSSVTQHPAITSPGDTLLELQSRAQLCTPRQTTAVAHRLRICLHSDPSTHHQCITSSLARARVCVCVRTSRGRHIRGVRRCVPEKATILLHACF